MEPGDSTLHEAEQVLMRSRLDGSLVKDKARILVDLYVVDRLADEVRDRKNANWLEHARMLIRLGDMEPKSNQAVQGAGTGFSVNIVIPQGGQAPGAHNPLPAAEVPTTLTLDVTPTLIASNPDTELPPKPEGFKMQDFQLTRDLIGPQLPAAPITAKASA